MSRTLSGSVEKPALSVLICFREKVDELPILLGRLSHQTYPDFEVLLINDGPVEQSNTLLENWANKDVRFRYIRHLKTTTGKKSALESGIRSADSDWLVFTDIDCEPHEKWLEIISENIPLHPSIILGVSPYNKYPGILNKIIRGETFLTAIQYLGWAQAGFPYMGVGRNLIYHRAVFERFKFDSHRQIPFGDDDLLVNEASRDFPVYVLTHPQSMVYSNPPRTWTAWYSQKARHLSAGKFYDWKTRFRISIFSLALGLEKILIIMVFLFSPLFGILLILIKALFLLYPVGKLRSGLGMITSLLDWLTYEWFHFIYLIIMSPYIFFKTKRKW